MTEDTLGFIAADAFNRTGNWEAAASAVREKVIEECIAVVLEAPRSASVESIALEIRSRLLDEEDLVHPHPRQDGQQCDHPGSGDVK